MRTSAATFAVLAVLLTGSVPLALQPGQDAAAPGAVRGAVTDGSAGVLPGVTVVAMAADGRVLATAVTDGAGAYALTGLPAGPCCARRAAADEPRIKTARARRLISHSLFGRSCRSRYVGLPTVNVPSRCADTLHERGLTRT